MGCRKVIPSNAASTTSSASKDEGGEGAERSKRKGMARLKVRFPGGVRSNLGQTVTIFLSHYETKVWLLSLSASSLSAFYFFAGALGFNYPLACLPSMELLGIYGASGITVPHKIFSFRASGLGIRLIHPSEPSRIPAFERCSMC